MARSRDMQNALDLVAGRNPAAPAQRKWGGLERLGLVLWVGVGLMLVGLTILFVLN